MKKFYDFKKILQKYFSKIIHDFILWKRFL